MSLTFREQGSPFLKSYGFSLRFIIIYYMFLATKYFTVHCFILRDFPVL